MRRVSDLLSEMERIAPPSYAMEGDNVGLQVGDGEAAVNKVLLSLDPDDRAIKEAERGGYDLLITHHALIFRPLYRLVPEEPAARRAVTLIRDGISLISMHTNLDAAEGGVNDALARALGLSGIGDFPNEDARPGVPSIGRIGFVEPTPGEDFVRFTVETLKASGARYLLTGKDCRRVAVAGGSCADYVDAAAAAGCDTLVTSECKYRHFTRARDLGISLIDAGHYATEAVVLDPLRERLEKAFPGLLFGIVRGDPLSVMERKEI